MDKIINESLEMSKKMDARKRIDDMTKEEADQIFKDEIEHWKLNCIDKEMYSDEYWKIIGPAIEEMDAMMLETFENNLKTMDSKTKLLEIENFKDAHRKVDLEKALAEKRLQAEEQRNKSK